jgi:hypothetical protein
MRAAFAAPALAAAFVLADKADVLLCGPNEMPRKITALVLAAAKKAEIADGWARLGFTLDASGDSIALADGVALDFFAPDDPAALGVEDLQTRAFLTHFAAQRSGVALMALSGDAEECRSARPEPLGGADCFVKLAPLREIAAPTHPNGVTGLKNLVAMVENPADYAELLAKLTGQREMLATSAGLEIRLGGVARLDLLTAPAFAFRFGFAAPDSSSFHIGGLVFAVDNLDATEKKLQLNGIATKHQAGRLVVGVVAGVAVACEQAGDAIALEKQGRVS